MLSPLWLTLERDGGNKGGEGEREVWKERRIKIEGEGKGQLSRGRKGREAREG